MLNDRTSEREAFLSALERDLAAVPESVAVLRMDLDRFERIREMFGAGTARVVHNRIIARMEALTSGPGRLLTYGPDSFIAVVDVPTPSMHALEWAAVQAIEAISAPIVLDDGTRIAVGCSVGVASGADFKNSDSLRILAAAELAIQSANSLGSRRVVVYRPGEHVDPTHIPTLFADMLGAIETDQFVPYFQPVVDLRDLSVVGAEALARWDHPSHGILLPTEFIGEAEASGLIRCIDESVLRHATAQAALWPQSELFVSINVSGADLDSEGIIDDVTASLKASGFAAHRLVLEVTETTLAQDWSRALERLQALKSLGIRLAVDDFGAGRMFLDRLATGVFDVLKIDRSIVVTSGALPTHTHVLLSGVTTIAHDLDMTVIAEGVETPEHLERVRAAGCDLAQGYLFGRPLSGPAFATSLAPHE